MYTHTLPGGQIGKRRYGRGEGGGVGGAGGGGGGGESVLGWTPGGSEAEWAGTQELE